MFTYKLTNMPEHEWGIYSDELYKLYQLYTSGVEIKKTQFLAIQTTKNKDLQTLKQICPTLWKQLEHWKIEKYLFWVAFIVVPPNSNSTLHIDSKTINDFSLGLNIPVLNCENTFTAWYDPDSVTVTTKSVSYLDETSNLNNNFISATDAIYYDDSAVEISRVEVIQPYWANAAVPHRPICKHNNIRINSSLRFTPSFNQTAESDKFNASYCKNI